MTGLSIGLTLTMMDQGSAKGVVYMTLVVSNIEASYISDSSFTIKTGENLKMGLGCSVHIL